MSVPDIVIITGLSGSGMSSATNAFQDLGYFCVDNLPVMMLSTFGRLVSDDEEKGISRAALVIDIREGEKSNEKALKAQIRDMAYEDAKELAKRALTCSAAEEVRALTEEVA